MKPEEHGQANIPVLDGVVTGIDCLVDLYNVRGKKTYCTSTLHDLNIH